MMGLLRIASPNALSTISRCTTLSKCDRGPIGSSGHVKRGILVQKNARRDASWRRFGGGDDGDRDYGGDKTFTKIMAVGGERENWSKMR